jgi:chaperonin GroEL
MSKEILFSDEARQKLLEGINLVAKAVTKTLGPCGKNSILSRDTAPPLVTNDGVSIASFFNKVADPWINTGIQMIKEVATKQNEPGDGTTTATLLAASLVNEGVKSLSAGADPVIIQEGIKQASLETIEKLKKIAKSITGQEELVQVATIAVEDEESGQLIGEMMQEVGKDGAITVEVYNNIRLEKEMADGMKIEQGFILPYFMTNPFRQEAVFEGMPILVTDHLISTNTELIPIVDKLTQKGIKGLVIICDNMRGEALATALKNTLEKNFFFLVIQLPGLDEKRTDNGEDIAIVCGARFINKNINKLEDIRIEDLGSADKVISKSDNTIIVKGAGKNKDIVSRLKILKEKYKSVISDFERDQIKERIARIVGKIGVIKVGAPTEQELNYKKYKIEDALAATRAAMEEGIVPGGGISLLRIADENLKNKELEIGKKIFYEAITMPIKKIAENAGKNPDTIIDYILRNNNFNYGWDAKTDKYVDMVEAGIIDPLKVVRTEIENAVSMATIFLSTESLICEILEENKDKK